MTPTLSAAVARWALASPSFVTETATSVLYRVDHGEHGPAALKLLVRFLFFLPGGNRVQGLREMQLGAERGELLRGEAFYQIALVDLWYEHAIDEALKYEMPKTEGAMNTRS